jgi:hypothetical protein
MQAALADPTEPLDGKWQGAIHTLFTRQAERVPDLFAVVDPNDRWTYSDMDRRSNQLANYLMAQGIKPKDVVAIERTREFRGGTRPRRSQGGAAFLYWIQLIIARLIDYHAARPRGWVQMNAAGELPEELLDFLATFEIPCRINSATRKDIAEFLAEYLK